MIFGQSLTLTGSCGIKLDVSKNSVYLQSVCVCVDVQPESACRIFLTHIPPRVARHPLFFATRFADLLPLLIILCSVDEIDDIISIVCREDRGNGQSALEI